MRAGLRLGRTDLAETMYFAALPLERDGEGAVVPGTPRETRSEIAAKCLAAAMAATEAGAVAIARMADDGPVILGRYGEVADEMLAS
jgi:hypothetical protein